MNIMTKVHALKGRLKHIHLAISHSGSGRDVQSIGAPQTTN